MTQLINSASSSNSLISPDSKPIPSSPQFSLTDESNKEKEKQTQEDNNTSNITDLNYFITNQYLNKILLLEKRIQSLENDNSFYKSRINYYEKKIDIVYNLIRSSPSLQLNSDLINDSLFNLESNEDKNNFISSNSTLNTSQINLQNLNFSMNYNHETLENIDNLINHLKPNEDLLNLRNIQFNFLKHFITRILTCCVFQVDSSILLCNLYDDTLKLSPILSINSSSNTLSNIEKILYESFIEYSNQIITFLLDETDYKSPINKKINPNINLNSSSSSLNNNNFNIHLSNIKLENPSTPYSKITGIINNISFEVSINSRVELCYLSFVEKFSNLVGKNNLFKKSLLLLKAYFSYECSSLDSFFSDENNLEKFNTNINIRDELSESIISYMLISIFNLYYMKISSPLDAFTIFFRVFSLFNPRTDAITLQGIKTFPTNSNEIVFWNNEVKCLIPYSLYFEFFNIVNVNGFNKFFIDPSEDNNTNQISSSSINNNDISDRLINVERTSYSIVHPFTFESMLNHNINESKINNIQDFIIKTNKRLNDYFDNISIKNSSNDLLCNSSNTTINNFFLQAFFPSSLSKINPQFSEIANDSFQFEINFSELWSNILCCNFILESILTESALITLCTQLLNDKKFLPIGEIGKILPEITGINNLSSQLREKFGGLKKFIEKYSNIFIISKDHHYNPNTTLKRLLTSKQINLLEQGSLNLQSIFSSTSNKFHIINSEKKNSNYNENHSNISNSINSISNGNANGNHRAITNCNHNKLNRNINGNLIGNVKSSSNGIHNGNLNNNISGNLNSNINGNLNNNINSNTNSNINGNMNGNAYFNYNNISGNFNNTMNGNINDNINNSNKYFSNSNGSFPIYSQSDYPIINNANNLNNNPPLFNNFQKSINTNPNYLENPNYSMYNSNISSFNHNSITPNNFSSNYKNFPPNSNYLNLSTSNYNNINLPDSSSPHSQIYPHNLFFNQDTSVSNDSSFYNTNSSSSSLNSPSSSTNSISNININYLNYKS